MPATSVAKPEQISPWRLCIKLSKLAAHTLICLLVLVTLPLHRRYIQRLSQWWYRRLLDILDVKIEVTGKLPANTSLIISNHVSWLDIVTYGSLMNPAFVSKAEVATWPVVGRIASETGTIFLPRGAFKTQQTSATLARSLDGGRSVVLFPEATTSAAATPERFHARLFAAAIDHNYPVQPIAIRYLPETPGLPGHHPLAPWVDDAGLGEHLWGILKLRRLQVRIIFCAQIKPENHDRRGLAEQSHQAITAALAGQ